MAFNNISTYKLKLYINSIDTNPNKLNNLIGDMDARNWNSTAKSRLKTALNDIKSNYTELNKIKSKGKEIANLIEQYKNTEKKLNNKRNTLSYVKTSILYTEEKRKEKVKELEREIANLKSNLQSIENRVNNYI